MSIGCERRYGTESATDNDALSVIHHKPDLQQKVVHIHGVGWRVLRGSVPSGSRASRVDQSTVVADRCIGPLHHSAETRRALALLTLRSRLCFSHHHPSTPRPFHLFLRLFILRRPGITGLLLDDDHQCHFFTL